MVKHKHHERKKKKGRSNPEKRGVVPPTPSHALFPSASVTSLPHRETRAYNTSNSMQFLNSPSIPDTTSFTPQTETQGQETMLATSHFPSSSPPPHNFLPNVPSPLSPRRVNAPVRNCWSSPINSMPSQSSHTPYSSRPIKQVPIPQRSDALRERRRDMFLRKVRQARDDNKWDSRIDDMARLDFMNEKRRWEAEQSRSAPSVYCDLVDAEQGSEHDLPTIDSQMTFEMDSELPSDQEIDAVLQRERAELEALVSMMQDEGANGQFQHQHQERNELQEDFSSAFGSDDEEYDSIFMKLIDENGGAARTTEDQHPADDEMDLS